ncbi:MAG: hypothetical protein ACETWE_08070 [Candidatus Bathyarchaeia archaeon]
MNKNAKGHAREEIVRQVIDGKDSSLNQWKTHITIRNAAKKLRTWENQSVETLYLTSRTKPTEVEDMRGVLEKYNFPDGPLFSRREGEEYKDIVERVMPDVIIEDKCESIGGKDEMTYTQTKQELKHRIRLIAVKEFGGIDYLQDNISP